MDWQTIREQYPSTWVLVEALAARTVGNERVIDDMVVVGTFADGQAVLQRYLELHAQDRCREYYPLHTDREKLDIGIIDEFGRTFNPR